MKNNERSKLSEKITKIYLMEVEKINQDAKQSADFLVADLTKKAQENNDENFRKQENALDLLLLQKEREVEIQKKQAEGEIKRVILDNIYDKTLIKMTTLTGLELFNLVLALLKKETIINNQEMRVVKGEYDKYREALSSFNNSDKVELDKLNSILKTNLYLTNIPSDTKTGFVLIGRDYDLSFDFGSLLDNIKTLTEHEIIERLFKK